MASTADILVLSNAMRQTATTGRTIAEEVAGRSSYFSYACFMDDDEPGDMICEIKNDTKRARLRITKHYIEEASSDVSMWGDAAERALAAIA